MTLAPVLGLSRTLFALSYQVYPRHGCHPQHPCGRAATLLGGRATAAPPPCSPPTAGALSHLLPRPHPHLDPPHLPPRILPLSPPPLPPPLGLMLLPGPGGNFQPGLPFLFANKAGFAFAFCGCLGIPGRPCEKTWQEWTLSSCEGSCAGCTWGGNALRPLPESPGLWGSGRPSLVRWKPRFPPRLCPDLFRAVQTRAGARGDSLSLGHMGTGRALIANGRLSSSPAVCLSMASPQLHMDMDTN